MTTTQTTAFFSAIAPAIAQANSKQGTKRLAAFAPMIKQARKMNVSLADIALGLKAMPDSPLKGLAKSTALQYVSHVCSDFKMQRRTQYWG